jgi:hypothetical protein
MGTNAFMVDDAMIGSFHLSLESLTAVVFFRIDAAECLVITISAYYLSTATEDDFLPLLLWSIGRATSRQWLFRKRSEDGRTCK